MNKKEKLLLQYLFEETKEIIKYFNKKNKRWKETVQLEINKVITARESLRKIEKYIINKNLENAISNLDKYLIDLDFMKNEVDTGKLIGFEDKKEYEILKKVNGKIENKLNIYSNYNPDNKSKQTTGITNSYKINEFIKIPKIKIVGLLREILLRLNYDEVEIDNLIKKEFKITTKKFDDFIEYKLIFVNDNFLSLPLKDLEFEYDYKIYIHTKESKRSNIWNIENYKKLYSEIFEHHITKEEFIYTKTMKDYYDRLS